jgi:hypothetical protein
MRLALNVDKVSHRTRTLIDVELECGCVITYEFEYEASKKPSIEREHYNGLPLAVKAEGGWWVSTLLHPGEYTEDCRQGDDCIGNIMSRFDAKRAGFELALRHVAELIPSQKG